MKAGRFQRLRAAILFAGLAAIGTIGAVGCAGHAPPTIVTVEGQRAFTADQAILRLNEFQNVIIHGADARIVPLPLAREIVTWLVGDTGLTPPKTGVVQALQSSPAGVAAVYKDEWKNLRDRLDPYPEIATWVPIINTLLGVE